MAESRKCPECGERLSFDALRCACGWGLRKGKGDRNFDHRCTFQVGGERCSYPVGMFPEGATSGWCIFHRSLPANRGGEVVQQSKTVPYAEAIKSIAAQGQRSPSVIATAHEIALRHGNKPWQESASEFVPDSLKRKTA